MMPLQRSSHPWRRAALSGGFAEVPPGGGVMIDGIDLISRCVDAGALFLACRGASTRGLDFAKELRARGIAAIAPEPGDDFSDRSRVLRERGGFRA